MIGYRVNNKTFNNSFLAYHESFKSGQPITFHCYDEENDRIKDWTKEPPHSLEVLMDIHAKKLRNKYERLVFMWSGGTDSQTIYNVFKRNNIHIDEIIIKHTPDINNMSIYPDSHVDWMRANHWDTTTVITPLGEYDTESRKIIVNNEDWIFQDTGDLLKFGHSVAGDAITQLCEDHHNGHNWGLVMGLEKPIITFKNGRWYTQQSDRLMRPYTGHERLECFFLDPVINLKQSHMGKRAMQKVMQSNNGNIPGFLMNNDQGSQHNYTKWATALGRHPELTTGVSFFQKLINQAVWATTVDPATGVQDFDNGEPMLVAKIKMNDPVAINYVKGIYNLAIEKDFFEWLNHNYLEKPGSIFFTKPILSKAYDLGV